MSSSPPPAIYKVHLALVATQVFFASLPVAGKEALLSFPWPAFATFRIGLAAVVFWALRLFTTSQRVARSDLKTLALYGFLGVAANQLQFLAGLARTKATHATILVTSIPVFTALLAALLGRERFSSRKGVGVAISLSGALGLIVLPALSAGKDFSLGAGQLLGNLFIVSNSLCYALYLVLSKDLLGRYHALVVASWMFLFGTLEVLAFDLAMWLFAPSEAAWAFGNLGAATSGAWLRLLYVVLIPTAAAYGLNSWALRFAPMSLVSVYIYVQPLVTAFLAYVILGESLHVGELFAAALIVMGVWVVARENVKQSADRS